MYKRFKIFSFLILSALWVNAPLQAIGGTEVEAVLDEEIKSKGILKIQYADGTSFGTGVLFQEGKGWLGLGVRHSFRNFHPLTCPILAWLGEEKRDIIKVYTPKEQNVDLALFILSSPFQDVEGFPTLPRSLPTTSIYEGNIYGYGFMTSPNHPGLLEASEGICRKGKLFATSLSQIEYKNHLLMSHKEVCESIPNNSLITFSVLQKKRIADANLIPSNENRELHKMILEDGYVPTKGKYNLPSSSSFPMGGDSGGPFIGEENQLYALHFKGFPNLGAKLYVEVMGDLRTTENYAECFKVSLFGSELSIG